MSAEIASIAPLLPEHCARVLNWVLANFAIMCCILGLHLYLFWRERSNRRAAEAEIAASKKRLQDMLIAANFQSALNQQTSVVSQRVKPSKPNEQPNDESNQSKSHPVSPTPA